MIPWEKSPQDLSEAIKTSLAVSEGIAKLSHTLIVTKRPNHNKCVYKILSFNNNKFIETICNIINGIEAHG